MSDKPGIIEMIKFSWAKSLKILMPFSFKRWFKVLIIVWLAMAGTHGCVVNFKVPGQPFKQSVSKTTDTSKPDLSKKATASQSQGTAVVIASSGADTEQVAETQPKSKRFTPFLVALGAGFMLFMLCIAFFFLWLFSRFNFVFLDVLVTGKTAIAESFKNHKVEGNAFFKWSLIFLGCVLGSFLLVGIFSIPAFLVFKENIVMGILLGIMALALLFLFWLGALVIWTVVRDFVLPIMYRNKVSTKIALHQLRSAKTFCASQIIKYLLVIFGLWIVAGIIQTIVGVIVAIGGLIAGGLVALPGIFLVMMIPLLKVPLIILGVLFTIVLILVVIAVIGLAMLPVAIFFRVFSLAYLTRLYPECDLLNFSHKQ